MREFDLESSEMQLIERNRDNSIYETSLNQDVKVSGDRKRLKLHTNITLGRLRVESLAGFPAEVTKFTT